MTTISACLMVKDEKHNLPRCLDSIVGVVDEIIIIDTGSTDNTVEIARKYTDKVYFHPWQNDFSLHRNQSISYATGDWLMIIDADEELHIKEGSKPAQEILSQLPETVNAVMLNIRDMQDGKQVMEFNSARLFRRGQVKYEGIVHNSPVFVGDAVLLTDWQLKHYGYDLTPKKKALKVERTMGLLKQRLKTNPDDHQAYFYLSQMYGEECSPAYDLDACISCAEMYALSREKMNGSFNNSIYFTLVQACMKSGDMQRAEKWLSAGVQSIPDDPDLALAQVEYGVAVNRPDIITDGAQRFRHLYQRIRQQPAMNGTRFTYSLKPESLAYCLYHLSFYLMQEGMAAIEQLQETLSQSDEQYAQEMRGNMATSFGNIGINWIHQGVQQ